MSSPPPKPVLKRVVPKSTAKSNILPVFALIASLVAVGAVAYVALKPKENKPIRLRQTCRTAYTQFDDDGNGNAIFFDRHNIKCEDDEMMQQVQLERGQGANSTGLSRMRFRYKCCKLTAEQ